MIIRTNNVSSGAVSNDGAPIKNDVKQDLQDAKSSSNPTPSLQIAANTINSEDVDKSNQVETIKQQVDDGSYKIDTQKTADKMAQDLLLES